MFIYSLVELNYYKNLKKKKKKWNQLSEIIGLFQNTYLFFLKPDILNSNDRCNVLSHKYRVIH